MPRVMPAGVYVPMEETVVFDIAEVADHQWLTIRQRLGRVSPCKQQSVRHEPVDSPGMRGVIDPV